MKAAVLTQLNAPLEIRDVELPWVKVDSHCGTGQALVEMVASGICGAQLKEIAGEKGNASRLPHLLGHEGVGYVRAVGAGVSTQMLGKKVVCHWRKGSGPEAFTLPTYSSNGESIGAGHVTTLSEQSICSANRLTVVPDDVPDELCALLGCGLSTALGTIEQEAKVRFGESVLIVGAGGVGLNLIMAARMAQAWPIFVSDLNSDKAALCYQLGAISFTNPRTDSIERSWDGFSLPGYARFDVIIDTSGSIEALEAVIPLLADGGRFVMVGQPKPGENLKIMGALDMFHGEQGRRIMTTQGGGFRPSVDIPRYIQLWRSGALKLDGIVSHRIKLDEINTGIDLVRQGQAGRIMVYMK